MLSAPLDRMQLSWSYTLDCISVRGCLTFADVTVESDSKPSELLSLAWSLNAKLEHVVDQISALHEGLYTAATAALK